MKFGGSKTTEVHQERRARPWRAPGGGLDAIIKTPSPPLHGICRPDESFRHHQQRWFMADTTKDGCPYLFVGITRSFHERVVARVQDQGQTSEPFSVTNCTKQGCVVAPLLFALVFSAMLYGAFHDNDLGALIRFRTDGNVFNLRRLNSKTRTSKVLIRDLLFADDCALLAQTVDDIQDICKVFARPARRFGR